MSTNTTNLNLLKKDPITDGNETFNITTMLNDNWDKIDSDSKSKGDAITAINNTLGSGVILNPVLYYGMNSKITNTGKDSALPKITFIGQRCVNLLGKDGNCEDVSKWTGYQSTSSLDTTNKIFGSNGIKITLTSTSGNVYKVLSSINIDVTKYYLASAYIKNGNATNINIQQVATGGGSNVQGALITDTTKFTRAGIIIQPSNLNVSNQLQINVAGVSGQYAYVDGIMIQEITASEYALGVAALLAKYPYVDSYACLQNPYVQTIHDNLVRNGNGEEGIAWWILSNANVSLVISNGKFQVTTNASGGGAVIQKINVKPSTNYYFRATTTGSLSNQVYASDGTTALLSGNSTFNSGTNTYVFVQLAYFLASQTGTADSIMLIEGTTAPSSYLPFRQERTEIEGMFTSDDTVILENGKASGLVNWKHKTLFGKDYDWQYADDYVGYKRAILPNFLGGVTGYSNGSNLVKYDGKILLNADSSLKLDNWALWTNNTIYLSLADADTGFAESIAPNNDEIKAFLNGWKAIILNSTRYTMWASVVDNSLPSTTVQATTNATTATTTLSIVSNGTSFIAGDLVAAINPSTGIVRSTGTVTGTSTATSITVTSAMSIVIGDIIAKVDNGTTNTSLLTWCKNNIAPNYQGYQLHYKLANPEPITDVNTPTHGNIPILDVGDNYVYLDSGIVLGEVANPVTNGAYWWINASDSYMNSVLVGKCQLKNKTEIISGVYKNTVDDIKNWTNAYGIGSSLAYGNAYLYNISPQVYDSTAVYTVDYKILTTQAPQVGTIACSYSQDVFTAIQKLEETMENKQSHDSALDTLVDLSMYEKFINYTALGRFTLNGSAAQASLYAEVGLVTKKVVPTITLSNIVLVYYDLNGSPNVLPSGSVLLTTGIWNNHLRIRCFYTGGNSTIVSNLLNYGGYFVCDIVVSCIGRI